MKKITALYMAICFFIAACNGPESPDTNVDNTTDTTASQNSGKDEQQALQQYKSYLDTLNDNDANNNIKAAEKYKALFEDKSATVRDSGFIIFSNYYNKLEKRVDEQHKKDTINFSAYHQYDSTGKRKPLPQHLKNHNDSLQKVGFEIATSEGITYIEKDRDFIGKWFYPYVSPTMKEYLEQLNNESKQGFASDASITLEPKLFVDRVIWWEKFINAHPDFVLLHEAKENKKYYLTYLLEGMDNTPVTAHQKKVITEYFKTAYSYLDETFSNTETYKLVKPYYNALQQKNTAKANDLLVQYKKQGHIIDYTQPG